jgi:methionyl aminopeptidase
MQLGDCFTIEPSIEQLHIAENGDVGGGDLWADGWTVVTKVRSPSHQGLCTSSGPDADAAMFSVSQTGARSAQYEHQLLITEMGAEVLTG